MGQDQVSGGVSVLCWLAAPVAMFYGNLQNLVIRSKSVIKPSSVMLLLIVDCGLTSHSAIFQLYSDGTDVQFPHFDLLPDTHAMGS